jgi:hypothetical protein
MSSLLLTASPWNTQKESVKKPQEGQKPKLSFLPNPSPPRVKNGDVDNTKKYQPFEYPVSDATSAAADVTTVSSTLTSMASILKKMTAEEEDGEEEVESMRPRYKKHKGKESMTGISPPLPSSSSSEVTPHHSVGTSYTDYFNAYQQSSAASPAATMSKKRRSKHAHLLENASTDEKLDYLIFLLEEQRMHRTQFITEEFLLYSFLGVFMIYVVDGFARSGGGGGVGKLGKYVR